MTKTFKKSELTPSSLSDDMVESRSGVETSVIEVEQIRICRLRKKFLEEDLLCMELQKNWKKNSEEEKIQNAVCNAEFAIMKWHVKLMEQEDHPTSFNCWKAKLKYEFGNDEISEGQYARIDQGIHESLYDYIIRMEDLGEKLGIEEQRRFSYIIEGINPKYWVIKGHMITEAKITSELKKKIQVMERDFLKLEVQSNKRDLKYEEKKKEVICFICHKNHYTNSCPDHPYKEKRLSFKKTKEVNEVDEDMKDFAINKSDFIYMGNKGYSIVLDTGAEDNFISRELATQLEVKIVSLKTPLLRFTVDGRRISIGEETAFEFFHNRIQTRASFYILPGSRKDKIILGRKWIKDQIQRKKYECSINTLPGAKVVEPSWSIPQKLREKTDEAIKHYEKKGYIRNSQSTWSNNIRPVEKPNGSIRIATNLIALNNIVELDRYSLPNIEELLFSLHGQKWFSKIDLKDGFFQIPLREEDKHKTAFRYGHKLKEWNVMPMGFKNAPAVFQRYMDHILRDELGKSCLCYVDDILIFGRTEEEHNKNLSKIKNILFINNMEINHEKSQFNKNQIEFLGHTIKENIIEKHLDDKEAIRNYPTPKNKQEIQRFLGLVNYYRKFIKNITQICIPLYELLRKDKEFVWGSAQKLAFDKLRTALLEPAVLHQPDYSKPFILETDASDTGLGAIISQKHEDMEFPIAYTSRMLIGAELNYSISEKECLGAIYGMEKFKYYLYGREFTLRTDHKALERLNTGPLKNARIERWCERLQNFSFKVEYRKGESIPHVDALSRTILEINNCEKISEEKESDLIKRTHEEMIHRGARAVSYRLKQQGLKYSEDEIRKAIKDCKICQSYNPKRTKGFKHVSSFERGEKVGFDIIGPLKKNYIITAVDYFTREGFAKRIPTRESKHVMKFIKDINDSLKIKMLISDGARENCDKELKNWLDKEGIKHHITSAHHSESNGRIERFNKTIMDGLRKGNKSGILQVRLNRILQQYQETYHEALDMTPNEAKDYKNWNGLKWKEFNDNLRKYKKKFKEGEWDKLEVGNDVLIRKEIGRKKDEPLFETKAKVIEALSNDSYMVKPENGRITKRHISQLKGTV